MITKFKIFESVNIGEPEIGDYVICEEESINNTDVKNYTENNIGKIVDNLFYGGDCNFLVKYNIDFKTTKFRKERFQLDFHPEGCRIMKNEEIEYWSKDKEQLEAILAIKKYNV